MRDDETALNTVQQIYAAFGRGDLNAILERVSDDVQWRFLGDAGAPYSGEVRGKAALADWFGAVARADDIQAFEPRRLLAGARHVTVIGWERTVARNSGRTFESDWVHVFELDGDGRVSRFLGTLDSEAAARARG